MSVTVKDEKYKKILKELKNCKKFIAKAGVLGNDRALEKDSVLTYALAHEFGTVHIPKRSFLFSTAREKKAEWLKIIEDGYNKLIEGRWEAKAILHKVALQAKDDVIDKISSNIPPPNSEETIKRKTRGKKGAISRTLIDKGRLRNSINYVVIEK
jgi:hypothetical protein